MSFEKEYFENRKYASKETVIKRHFMDVLKWASHESKANFFDGKGKNALAVGCGFGFEVDMLTSFGYNACGIDISKFGVRKASILTPSTDFIVCDVQRSVPFKANSFDLLTCFGVLEHLHNPIKALKNMFATCRDAIICTSPNRLVEKPLKQLARDADETHINVKSKREWEKAINEKLARNFLKIDPFFDASVTAAGKLLFFHSFKVPYFGLDFRILIRKQ